MGEDRWLKLVRGLHRKKEREEQGLFLVQGRKLVRELLASGLRVHSIHATEEAAKALGLHQAQLAPAHVLARMGTLEQGNEVVAVVHTPPAQPPRAPGADELVLALDGISDPGNLGTLLRIADWFGCARLWCSPDCVEVFNPKAVQASMGSVFRVEVLYGDLPEALQAAQGAHIYKAEATGEEVFGVPLERPAVLVLGSESHGLREEVRRGPGRSIAVPRLGGAESLNVAAAAAALCMEFVRRR